MTGVKLLEGWFDTVTKLALSSDPNENMLFFPAASARKEHVLPEQLVTFLEQAFREYSRKASRARQRGWFYAWFDQMSDTIRCSMQDAPSTADLPFRCKIEVVTEARGVALLALESSNDRQFLSEEFRPTDVWNDVFDAGGFVLKVFARRLITTSS